MSMHIGRLGLIGILVASLGGTALAQDEPAGGGDDTGAGAGSAAPAGGDGMPSTAPAGGDGMPSSAAPGGDGMGDEDEAALEEGGKKDEGSSRIGIGVRLRYISIPNFLINLFVESGVPVSSVGIGGELVRRRQNFDIVIGVEYEKTSPADGYWEQKGETPGQPGENPDFTEFENFGLLSADISFVWHKPFTEQVALRYGAGIGAGLVLGKFFQTDTMCSGSTLDTCVAIPTAPRVQNKDVPPVVPVVNLLVGLRVKANDQLSFDIEGGFRDMFYFGGGATYFF